jgi:hypothetical protein
MRCGPKLGQRAGIGVHVADRIDLWNFRNHSLGPVAAPTPQANLQDSELIHWREQSKQICVDRSVQIRKTPPEVANLTFLADAGDWVRLGY